MADERIEKPEQFPDTPDGWARRWFVEFAGARKALQTWRERGRKVIDKYLDERANEGGSRLNLFHGDIETKKALLYGNTPRVRSRRRFADADDDEARVSAEMQQRMLNTDIERDEDGFETALELARDDRLLPGLGVIRMRYVAEFEDVPEQPAKVDPATGAELAPAVPAGKHKSFEDVETDYVHWEDYLWSPCRFWREMRWEAFAADMTREELHKRFDSTISSDEEQGPLLVDAIPLNSDNDRKEKSDEGSDPWARARVWEIWCKEGREVFWYVEGYSVILDRKSDPLGLSSFWPNPRPMFANVTSKRLVPVPDYCIAQDLYEEIDRLSDRISTLQEAVRVTGGYDQTNEPIKAIVSGGANRLYPVANWQLMKEKGGLSAAVEILSMGEIVENIAVLSQRRAELIALKDQVTGIADVMRGNATPGAGKTATEQRIKARFGSTRIQAAQKEFARFASDAQKIRAEIIAKWFDPETIIQRSNVERTKDAQWAPRAAQLLKDEASQYRVEVAAEGLGMTDMDAVKSDRTEFVTMITGALGEIAKVGQVAPWAVPHLLKLVKHGASAFPGAQELEGTFDELVAAADTAAQQAQQAAMQPQTDPKVEAEKVKAGATQVKAQADVMLAKAKMQQTVMDTQARQQEHAMRMQESRASFGERMAEHQMRKEEAADVEAPR